MLCLQLRLLRKHRVLQILEVRDAIDSTNDEIVLRRLQVENEEKLQACDAALAEAFTKGNLLSATAQTRRMSYLQRIREELSSKLP
eukprot:SM000047S16837  [mRNA]  locus=s47:200094:200479:+ [translate_table: standard]